MKILLENIKFPEGPAFDKNGTIWIVEKEDGNLISIKNQEIRRHKVNGHPNGITIDKKNRIWFCDSLQNSVRKYNPDTNQVITIVSTINDSPLKMPNDLAFDEYDNLIFTCPGDSLSDHSGYVCCLNLKNEIKTIIHNLQYPNGLAFSKDYKNLYIAETGSHLIWKFDWDSTNLSTSNGIKWLNTGGPIGPDGIALDNENNLYVAVYGSSFIKKYNELGNLIEQIPTIGTNPTNCAIDPKGNNGLIITEAQLGLLIQVPSKTKGIL